MSVRNHRIAAVSILASGLVVLFAWGRSMAVDRDEVRSVRDQLRGTWVASLVQAGPTRKAEGKAAEGCRVEFDGHSVAFHRLVGEIEARGRFYIDPSLDGRVDFKLDAGWIIGLFELKGDTLTLCMNPFAPPERLGVPTLARPKKLHSDEHRHLYVFQRATSNP